MDSIIAKVLPNFDLKNMVLAYMKYFSRKMAQICQISREKKSKNTRNI
jgi:hypothetical protein